ncbi:MAG: transcriptional regulator [Pseudomonadota bacterium]
MGQQIQRWRTAGGEKLWLSMLIDAMEQVSRSELRSQPCDRSVAAAVFAQLSRPAAPYAYQGPGFSLRH